MVVGRQGRRAGQNMINSQCLCSSSFTILFLYDSFNSFAQKSLSSWLCDVRTAQVEVEEFLMGCLRLRGPATAIDMGKVLRDQNWVVQTLGTKLRPFCFGVVWEVWTEFPSRTV